MSRGPSVAAQLLVRVDATLILGYNHVIKSGPIFYLNKKTFSITVAFSALTLLAGSSSNPTTAGRQEEHPAYKKLSDEVLVWLSVWSRVHIVCIWSS